MTKEDKNMINRLIKQAERIIGIILPSVDIAYYNLIQVKFDKIMKDVDHPLYKVFIDAIIPRSGRMRLPRSKTNRYISSFIPNCIKLHNSNFSR